MDLDATICPKCKSEETYCSQDWLGKELRECEECGCLYQVDYDIKVQKITVKSTT